MIAIDTNILVRAIADDANTDAATVEQQRQARAVLASGARLLVPTTVVVELEWVLRSAYGHDPEAIAGALATLNETENITVDRAGAVSQAIQWYRQGLDFADAMHLAQSGLCAELVTFDRTFAKRAKKLGAAPPVSATAA